MKQKREEMDAFHPGFIFPSFPYLTKSQLLVLVFFEGGGFAFVLFGLFFFSLVGFIMREQDDKLSAAVPLASQSPSRNSRVLNQVA